MISSEKRYMIIKNSCSKEYLSYICVCFSLPVLGPGGDIEFLLSNFGIKKRKKTKKNIGYGKKIKNKKNLRIQVSWRLSS